MNEPLVPAAPVLSGCPYLQLADDSPTKCLFPTAAHVCASRPARVRLDLDVQSSHCLSDQFTACARYQSALVARSRAPKGGLGAAVRKRTVTAVWLGLAACIMVGLAVLIIDTLQGGTAVSPELKQATPAVVRSQPSPAPKVSATPVVAVAAAVVVPVVETANQMASGAPAGEGEREHAVELGETLSGIATGYGVSLTELAARNGLSTNAYVVAGDRLVIPAPAGPAAAR